MKPNDKFNAYLKVRPIGKPVVGAPFKYIETKSLCIHAVDKDYNARRFLPEKFSIVVIQQATE